MNNIDNEWIIFIKCEFTFVFEGVNEKNNKYLWYRTGIHNKTGLKTHKTYF